MTDLWIGFDFDGTLVGPPTAGQTHGPDYPIMVNLLKTFLELGITVKIFSARAGNHHSRSIVQSWLNSRGLNLDITDTKDFNLALIIDDLAIPVSRGEITMPISQVNSLLSRLNFSIQPL
jgi:hypothetical protein